MAAPVLWFSVVCAVVSVTSAVASIAVLSLDVARVSEFTFEMCDYAMLCVFSSI